MKNNTLPHPIKAIIGLGNPGLRYVYTRHNIGFRVVDELAKQYGAHWRKYPEMEYARLSFEPSTGSPGGQGIALIKPQTYMNNSGVVIPSLKKDGIKPEEILVVHDELELPFGDIAFKFGGSAKGHNGLKSIIAACGADFARLRVGIGRPPVKEQVPDYVLQTFDQSNMQVDEIINRATALIVDIL